MLDRLWLHVARDIERAIATGRLAPGDLLPAASVVASRMGVRAAVVRRAYRVATRAGWLEAAGRGRLRVAPDAAARAEAERPDAGAVARLAGLLGLRLDAEAVASRLAARGACSRFAERLPAGAVGRGRRAWLGHHLRWGIRRARQAGLSFEEIVALFEAAVAWERCRETANSSPWLGQEDGPAQPPARGSCPSGPAD